jgi:hypothetical protein
MNQRTSSLPVLVVVAVLALLLGSLGTAVAAPALTKGQVKKIATKVVDKKASSLSVARAALADTATLATTATTATTLSGSTAAQLKTTGYKYVLPVQAQAGDRAYTFPGLPAGTYYLSYSLSGATSAAAGILACDFDTTPSDPNEAQSFGTTQGASFSRASSSAIVAVAPTAVLGCSVNTGTFAISTASRSSVSFIPIDTLVNGSAAGARGTSKAGLEVAE